MSARSLTATSISAYLLVLLLFIKDVVSQSTTDHDNCVFSPTNNNHGFYFSGDVLVSRYRGTEDKCTEQDFISISEAMERIMMSELGEIGFKRQEVIVCEDADHSLDRRRRLVSSSSTSSSSKLRTRTRKIITARNTTRAVKQPVLSFERHDNITLHANSTQRHLLYYGGFIFKTGGRCGEYCPPDDLDRRRKLTRWDLSSFSKRSTTPMSFHKAKKTLSDQKEDRSYPVGNPRSGDDDGSRHRQLTDTVTDCKRTEKVVEFNTFRRTDYATGLIGWSIQRSNRIKGFGQILGPFTNGETPERVFGDLNEDYDLVVLEFIFHQFDEWKGSENGDTLNIYIDGHLVTVGPIDSNKDEGTRSGYVWSGNIYWSMSSWTKPSQRTQDELHMEQSHKFVASFPRATNGPKTVHLKLEPVITTRSGHAGFDQIRLRGVKTCEGAGGSNSSASFIDQVEKHLESELELLLYHEFAGKANHCLKFRYPRVELDLSEEPSWEVAKPSC